MPNSQLVELYAHGVGVIEDARVEFGSGFNVLTGETGAGKTLLLEALDLCLGGDAAASRHAIVGDMRAAAVFVQRDGREVVLARHAGVNAACAVRWTKLRRVPKRCARSRAISSSFTDNTIR